VNFIYTFPKPGNYEISARFYNQTDIIVENSYPINVVGPENNYKYYLTALALIIFIALPLLYIAKIRSKRNLLRRKK
jgi:hypothetical protein